ncbi:MAG: amino acid permease [Chloroflexi bacterium HGW-Chloroflexi-2]|jgi:amino acid transporter|nr:MAG: amino acid permease [Chloroflexi bacterium HGW-Chloroflexi-2]
MGFSTIKRILIGAPFPTSHDTHERLDKKRGLAIFASDPISSNAYATEAIMHVLVVLGSGALAMTMQIGLAVAMLVLLVIFSYVQTIMHYPEGGGSYMVSKDNLGKVPSLVAAAALLVDYTLTASVSISAGVRAVTSAFPELFDFRVYIALVVLILITWINLRGVRESGTIFAIPAYAFVAGVLAVILVGLARYFGLFGMTPMEITPHIVEAQVESSGFLFIWLILRAFAGGCTALTGIEAISDGVKAFKPPESKNAAITMVAMGIIAMTLFIGITFLATHLLLVPEEAESILSQLTRRATGTGFLYFWVQFFTAAILFLAANTGFQDFPRLSFFLARDNFLPRWLMIRGDRLVYSAGIVTLSLLAAIVILIFQANEIAMLPLYALGVMLGFSLSQAGMFRLMGRIGKLKPGQVLHTKVTKVHYEKGSSWKRAVNALGATVTSLVFIILLVTKFIEGAWIVAVIIPLVILLFFSINKHYENVAHALTTQGMALKQSYGVADVVIVPVADVHRGTLLAMQYAARLSKDVRVLTVFTDEKSKNRFEKRWKRFNEITDGMQLIKIEYDYRDILNPIINYIKNVNDHEFKDQLTTVVVPEFIPESKWASWLHNQTASRLRNLLRDDKDIVLIEVPFHVDDRPGHQYEEELIHDEDDLNGEEVIETLIMVGGDDQDNSKEKTDTKAHEPKDDFSSSDEYIDDLKD